MHKVVDRWISENAQDITALIVCPPLIYGTAGNPDRQSVQIPMLARTMYQCAAQWFCPTTCRPAATCCLHASFGAHCVKASPCLLQSTCTPARLGQKTHLVVKASLWLPEVL